MLPSGPDVMPGSKKLVAPGIDKEKTWAPALTAVAGWITPNFPSEASVNQILPSGPAVMPDGIEPVIPREMEVMEPAVVMMPILSAPCSVNQRLPSGPGVIS